MRDKPKSIVLCKDRHDDSQNQNCSERNDALALYEDGGDLAVRYFRTLRGRKTGASNPHLAFGETERAVDSTAVNGFLQVWQDTETSTEIVNAPASNFGSTKGIEVLP